MTTHRVFWDAPDLPKPGEVVTITGDEARHAAAVKRLHPGEPVELFTGRGVVALGQVVQSVTGKRAELVVAVSSVSAVPPPPPGQRVVIASAVPKGDRAAQLVDQLSQLNAHRWQPLLCERSVTDPAAQKLDRLRRTAIESAKQCGRAHTLVIDEPATPREALAQLGQTEGPELAVYRADAGEPPMSPGPRTVPGVVFVGPEGGFTEAERRCLMDAGATPASLGPLVLRIETAAAAAAAILGAGTLRQ